MSFDEEILQRPSYSAPQVARMLGVSPNTVKSLLEQGAFFMGDNSPAGYIIKKNGRWRILCEAVDNYLKAQEQKAIKQETDLLVIYRSVANDEQTEIKT